MVLDVLMDTAVSGTLSKPYSDLGIYILSYVICVPFFLSLLLDLNIEQFLPLRFWELEHLSAGESARYCGIHQHIIESEFAASKVSLL